MTSILVLTTIHRGPYSIYRSGVFTPYDQGEICKTNIGNYIGTIVGGGGSAQGHRIGRRFTVDGGVFRASNDRIGGISNIYKLKT